MLISTVRVLEVYESNMRLLFYKFLLFLFIFEVFVLDYSIIHIFWFTVVYIFITIKFIYILKIVRIISSINL